MVELLVCQGVRDAAHVTPENFELCVKTIRIFVEASLNGGSKSQEKRGKSHRHDSKTSRLKKKAKGELHAAITGLEPAPGPHTQ